MIRDDHVDGSAWLTPRDSRIEAPDGRSVGLPELLSNADVSHLEGQNERLSPGQTAKAIEHARGGMVAIA
jgi:hypothetical protein